MVRPDVQGVSLRVEERHEECNESEHEPDDEGCVCWFLERGLDDERPCFPWRQAWSQNRDGDGDGDEHDKGHGTYSPSEADGLNHPTNDDGIDDTA